MHSRSYRCTTSGTYCALPRCKPFARHVQAVQLSLLSTAIDILPPTNSSCNPAMLHSFPAVQLAAHSLLFAVVNVVLSTLAFIPVMLFGPSLQLSQSGWSAMDAALMGAMLGSTDAVAVSAILKAGAGVSSMCSHSREE